MKPISKILGAFFIITLTVFVYTSCKKEVSSSPGQQQIRIRLSDDPVNFGAVNVDIQKVIVQVIPDSCLNRTNDDDNHDGDDDHQGDGHDARCTIWDTLNIHPGVYNLLNLANGTDTILASGTTISGKITKIRLILGDHNSVVIDSVSYPLSLYNNNHTITIKVKTEDVDQLTPSMMQFWLDFDAGRSIVRVDNNHFVLRPFLRVWLPSHTASISGRVLPGSAHAIVAAIFNGDTLIAIPSHDEGYFKIRGITSTTTNLFINATANGYHDTTITAIPLTIGRDKNIGTIQLHQ